MEADSLATLHEMEEVARASKKGARAVGYQHPAGKDEFGVWQVPTTGLLSFNFNIQEAMAKVCGVEDEHGSNSQEIATNFIHKWNELVRSRPGFRKTIPLLVHFCQWRKSEHEQALILEALSLDFVLDFAHVQQLHKSRAQTVKVIPRLAHCLNTLHDRFLTMVQTPNIDEFVKTHDECRNFFAFNAENPTAQYKLDLGKPADYSVFQMLGVLDRWEALGARQRGLVDQSRLGNWTGMRHAEYADQDIKYINDIHLPKFNTLKLFYSGWRRPPSDAIPVSNELWQNVLTELLLSPCRTADKLAALHCVSHQLYIDCSQLRELLSSFYCSADRSTAISTFTFRLTDPQNMKIIRSRLGDAQEKLAIISKLGLLACFPFFQPEEACLCMDLSTNEGRIAASILLQLAFSEGGGQLKNIREPELKKPDGTMYDFVMGVSPSWTNASDLPPAGLFSLRYVCAPDDRKVSYRHQLARKYGSWRVADDAAICWWSALSEAPDSVLTLLYYILRDPSLKSLSDCWKKLDDFGMDRITLHTFRGKMEKWRWKEMQSEDKSKEVFRFLDSDGRGDIGASEFHILHQLLRELELSILEFLQYLDRTFGGNFAMAWEELGGAGDGLIDFDEWTECIQDIGYFGEGTPIFNYACNSRRLIDKEGWRKLMDLWQNRVALRNKIFGVK
jgi:hypothetical protein